MAVIGSKIFAPSVIRTCDRQSRLIIPSGHFQRKLNATLQKNMITQFIIVADSLLGWVMSLWPKKKRVVAIRRPNHHEDQKEDNINNI